MVLKFVNVYLVDRAKGGNEEGGWWYDYGLIEKVYPVADQENAEKLQKYLEEGEFSNEDRRSDIGSVLSEGRFDVLIEDAPGESWPSEKPFYE